MNRRHLSALAAAVLLLAGCSPTSAGSGTAEPSSPAAIATSTASAISAPTPTPSADAPIASPSASPSDAPEVQLGYGAGLIVGTAVDVFATPSDGAEPVGRAEAGERVVVGYAAPGPEGADPVFGPVEASGETWYPVETESALEPPYTVGWMSITAADATVDEAVDCPSSRDAQLTEMVEMAPQERLACFGGDEIELEGRMALSGLGGMAFGTWEPMWLAYPMNAAPLVVEGTASPVLQVFFAPGVTPPTLPSGSTDPTAAVRVVGHFDDPASDSCVVQAPAADEAEPGGEVELYCRTHFVATEVDLLDA